MEPKLVLTGKILTVNLREVTKKDTGEKLTFASALVVGESGCLAEVSLNSDQIGAWQQLAADGDRIEVLISVSCYRNQPQLRTASDVRVF